VNHGGCSDPVGYIRPDLADVAKYAKNWVNINAQGGGITFGNFVAGIGRAWNDAPFGYANQHIIDFQKDHVNVCREFCGSVQNSVSIY
jgi:hypothetical protein